VRNKVLIVDDDLAICTAIETILSMKNYQTITAHTGLDSLKIAQSEEPDLILLDYMLPDMTGKQVVEKMRTYLTLKDTPIILISATHGLRQLVKDAAIQGIIEKPFELETLTSTVARYIPSH